MACGLEGFPATLHVGVALVACVAMRRISSVMGDM